MIRDAQQEKQNAAIDNAEHGRNEEGSDGRGNQQPSSGSVANQVDSAPHRGTGSEGTGEFALEGQTLDQVDQQEADRVAAEAAARPEAAQEAADRAAAERKSLEDAIKARAANPDNFQFGESSKDAAKPMGSLFDQPAATPQSNKSESGNFAAGQKDFAEGKPRILPSYFTASNTKNAKDWYRGWDSANVAANSEPVNVIKRGSEERKAKADALRAERKAKFAALQEKTRTEKDRKASSDAIVDFVSSVLEGKDHPHSIIINVSTDGKTAKVLSDTGVDIKNAREILIDDRVVHITDGHPNLTLADWAMLPSIAETFDSAHNGKPEGDPKTQRLIFVKLGAPHNYVYVAEFASGKKYGDRLILKTFFKDTERSVQDFLEKNKKEIGASVGAENHTPPASNAPQPHSS